MLVGKENTKTDADIEGIGKKQVVRQPGNKEVGESSKGKEVVLYNSFDSLQNCDDDELYI